MKEENERHVLGKAEFSLCVSTTGSSGHCCNMCKGLSREYFQNTWCHLYAALLQDFRMWTEPNYAKTDYVIVACCYATTLVYNFRLYQKLLVDFGLIWTCLFVLEAIKTFGRGSVSMLTWIWLDSQWGLQLKLTSMLTTTLSSSWYINDQNTRGNIPTVMLVNIFPFIIKRRINHFHFGAMPVSLPVRKMMIIILNQSQTGSKRSDLKTLHDYCFVTGSFWTF